MGRTAAASEQSATTEFDHPSPDSFSDSVARLLDRLDCRRIDSPDQRDEIFRLRYRAYLREGSISANSSGTFADPFDDIGDVYLFGFYIDGELASSVRVHVGSSDSPEFPSREVFADLLQPQLDAGKIIVDPTRFVTDENLSRRYRTLSYAAARLPWLAGLYFNADHLLAAIRVEHQAFYRRTFLHQLLCGPRPYPRLAKPISLMTTHCTTVADRVHRRYPFLRSTFFERRMLFDRSVTHPGPPCPRPAIKDATQGSA